MAHTAGHHSHGHHHITPVPLLLKVFGGLVFLTVTTALTAQIDLGVFNVPLALAIAGGKATLVILFFMALKWDSPVNRLVALMGIVFALIFLTFTLFDTLWRGDTSATADQTIMEMERRAEERRAREPAPELLRVTPSDFAAPIDTAAAPADTAAAAATEVQAEPDTAAAAEP